MSSLLWLLGLAISASVVGSASPAHAPPAWTDERLVAHALGGIDGYDYTNAYEAFTANYARGFRLFEADLLLTSDGALVARHEWGAFFNRKLEQNAPDVPDPAKDDAPLSLRAFKSLPIHGAYRPMDLDDLLALLKKHPDAYLITDTKSTDPAVVARQFGMIAEKGGEVGKEVLARIIPQLYDLEMYAQVEAIYPFPSYILTLYASQLSDDEVVEYVRRHPKIGAVTMPGERASSAFVERLGQAGARVYAHTINDAFACERYRQLGVNGVYTDFLDPSSLREEPPLRAQLDRITTAALGLG
ncbi:phosphatidylinositol-specific phospholipase C/glycerophosphodiester phosphodiesterase family protein [Cohnella sp. REN36]|uniref:phosphatidylinositol-specific phospholipase C/glycerophosphodiester phosphodiesterase family protein n=1 Tax=Cohnella sp. REN36 TaxID=2887347 RepID=UPI001D14C136|nr:phosphatidylinositol-specific phospholipase C/glycerophosphodiester phosphodiesterase family protein [Cohnella sp. REN36]MCC3377432.1 glycerophosphodiester phosphodiesterase [Cohnella sp. REN36]